MVGSGPHQVESKGSQREDHFVNREQRRDREGSVHTTHTSRRGVVAISPMKKIPKPGTRRFIIWKGSCATSGKGELPPFLISLLAKKRMAVIGGDQGLLPVSLSRMMRNTTMSTKTKTYLPKAWGMMQWAECSNKFPNHLLVARLRKGDFLDNSLSPLSPYTTIVQTEVVQWSGRRFYWLFRGAYPRFWVSFYYV